MYSKFGQFINLTLAVIQQDSHVCFNPLSVKGITFSCSSVDNQHSQHPVFFMLNSFMQVHGLSSHPRQKLIKAHHGCAALQFSHYSGRSVDLLLTLEFQSWFSAALTFSSFLLSRTLYLFIYLFQQYTCKCSFIIIPAILDSNGVVMIVTVLLQNAILLSLTCSSVVCCCWNRFSCTLRWPQTQKSSYFSLPRT